MTTSDSKVLIPLDGSALAEQAIPYAAALAAGGRGIMLLTVVPVVESEPELHGMLATAAARWQSVITDPELRVAAGDPAELILAEADEVGADLIVMASHGRGAVGRWTFGSVADRVARTAAIPVLIVRPGTDTSVIGPASINRLLVATDGSALSARAFSTTIWLAKRLRVPIHVMSVNEFPASLLLPAAGGLPLSEASYQAMLSEGDSRAKAAIRAALDTFVEAGLNADGETRDGLAAQVLLDAMLPGDLVVIGSHGRSGLRRWLIGSVAEKLVRYGTSPVVLVPPIERQQMTT